MSIDVSIKQKGFFKKEMPLEIILNNDLKFGCFGEDGIRLVEGEMGNGYFVAYNSNHMGRGFRVFWKKNEKNDIKLRALTPSHPNELDDFFDTVKRIADYWKCELEVDGTVMDVKDFLAKKDEYQQFNVNYIKEMIDAVATGKQENCTIICVMFPLIIGKEEAIRFKENLDVFFQWMHEKQSLDAYYGVPRFYQKGDHIFSGHVLTEEARSIFPIDPNDQIELMNIIKNGDIKCDENVLSLYSFTEDGVIGVIPYQCFIEYIRDKCERFDDKHILVPDLPLDEMKKMIHFAGSVQ